MNNLYGSSNALLIGVPTNKLGTVQRLPYTEDDLNSMDSALTKTGFTVDRLKKVPNNDNIQEAIRSAILNTKANDRLIIYISAHGFIDKLTNKPYIICSDCNEKNPVNCVSILSIKELLDQTKGHYKHVLLILDSCFSGLGIIDKSSNNAAIRTIASNPGSHIMTAGLGDQLAKMDVRLKKSVFTHYLTEGLSTKKADYTKDGIVTLTELLIYVQFNVARHTNSLQTPMMGRINGLGEMIF